MPELPEVETVKNALKKAIVGAKILNTEVFCRRFRMTIPENFEEAITGATIVDVKRIAKYILISLHNNQNIIWHLGMSGKIKTFATDDVELQKHDHLVIKTDKCTLVYNDARRFGMVTVCESNNLENFSVFQNIGKDPFDETLTADYLLLKFKNKRIAIKVVLLDQSIINGIGNIYASEALYLAKILPQREALTLTKQECETLIESVREVLEKAIKAGGSTLRDYIKPDGSTGYFQNQHCVYNKTGKPCPECVCNLSKTKGIRKIVQAGRSTFYCETLQK